MAIRSRTRTTSTRSTDGSGASPRLPHEHDESADSVAAAPRQVIQQAHDDLARGLVDTDRGPAADAAYRKQQTAAPKAAAPRRGGKP